MSVIESVVGGVPELPLLLRLLLCSNNSIRYMFLLYTASRGNLERLTGSMHT